MVEDKVVFVARLAPDQSNADMEGYADYPAFIGPAGEATNAVRMNIQPASAELTAISEGVFAKTFKAFTRASGVVETFRLTVSGTGDKYYTHGREVYDYPVGKHYELVLIKDKR